MGLNRLKQSGVSLSCCNDYYSQVVHYQESRRPPLLESSHKVLSEEAFVALDGLRHLSPKLAKACPPATQAIYDVATFIDTPAYNLTRGHLGLDEKLDDVACLVESIYDACGIVCSVVGQVYDDCRQSDDLLVACPDSYQEKIVSHTTKTRFFAFLAHKQLITEQDLYASNVVLGSYASMIAAEQRRFGQNLPV